MIPNRILKLEGYIFKDNQKEKLEIIIFKGFGSSTTHSIQIDSEKRAERIDVESLASDVSIFTNKIFFSNLHSDAETSANYQVKKSMSFEELKSERDKLAEAHLSETLGIDYGG